MRQARVLLLIAYLAAGCVYAASEPYTPEFLAQKERLQQKHALSIRVQSGGWGSAKPEEIEAVLYSVAAEMLPHFPGTRLYPMIVSHTNDAPRVLYDRGSKNEYRVLLTAKDRKWSHYAYEFAHELSHILTNYQHHVNLKMTKHHQWFEETLCEVASLYALKMLGRSWQNSPPFASWAQHAPEFDAFVLRFLNEPHRNIPTPLAVWFSEKSDTLQKNPYERKHNEVVANLLLPLFEENPEVWDAIAYLNMAKPGDSFRDYLLTWRDNAPEQHRDLIVYLMALFGMPGDTRLGESPQSDAASAPSPGAVGRPAAR